MFYHKPKRRSKIPFNFKPVPKSELAKTQQLKAAALKAKQTTDVDKTLPARGDTGPNIVQDELKNNKQNVTTTSQCFLNRTTASHVSQQQPHVTRTAAATNAFDVTSRTSQASDDATAALEAFINQNCMTQSEFKVPETLPNAKNLPPPPQSQLLQVSTQRVASVDVEMVSAGRSASKAPADYAQTADDIDMLSAKTEVKLSVSDDFVIDLTDKNVTATVTNQCQADPQPSTAATLDSDLQVKDEKVNAKEKLKAAILESALRKQRGG